MVFQKGNIFGKLNIGKIRTKKMKEKYSKYRRGKSYEELYGKEKAKDVREKQSENLKKNNPMSNIIHKQKMIKVIKSLKARKKQRLKAIKYIETTRGNIRPNIGRNEERIINEIELSMNKKIIRQYQVVGYFVDGYCKELNLVIEVDEIPKITERDIRREKEIQNKLNCNFIRIQDY